MYDGSAGTGASAIGSGASPFPAAERCLPAGIHVFGRGLSLRHPGLGHARPAGAGSETVAQGLDELLDSLVRYAHRHINVLRSARLTADEVRNAADDHVRNFELVEHLSNLAQG